MLRTTDFFKIGVSSNGRTAVSGTVNRGSSPCTPATHFHCTRSVLTFRVAWGTGSELLHFRKGSNAGRKIICDVGADFVTDYRTPVDISHSILCNNSKVLGIYF